MKLSAEQFRKWDRKAITLLGMSGVGKTRLACTLRKEHWFHYSGDYRIGTHYLNETILDNVKQQALQIPLLKKLLLSDSIHIDNNISVDNLKAVSTFLGELGDPEKGGLGLREFKRRQTLHRNAEIAAMKDVPEFIKRSHDVYGYDHFINDAGGSLCELDDQSVLDVLSEHTLIIYIKATEQDEVELIKRAEEDPKPLYYREEFLDEQLNTYLEEKDLGYAAMIEPDDFVRWVFSRLFYNRIPRYKNIAEEYGYTLSTNEITKVNCEADFLTIVESALEQQS
ncbi:MAG: ATPase [Proteobacteria bacterium]|nr:ATPase [Pseudomonadota bacterium]